MIMNFDNYEIKISGFIKMKNHQTSEEITEICPCSCYWVVVVALLVRN
jgi:hypothetical protein